MLQSVIVVGEMLRDVYQIPRRRVHVILNGVDKNVFQNNLSLGLEFRSKLDVPVNGSLVLRVAGRLVKDKGHPLLYEAFSKLITKHPHVYLIVAGTRVGEPIQGIRPQGLDLTLMEAMISGKAVVASRFPSIKGSIVVDYEFGFMFSPNVESLLEALEEVVGEGPKRLARRGKASQEYAASTFTASKIALAYERLFLCIKSDTFCVYPWDMLDFDTFITFSLS
ncbi:Kinase superfamily protein [Hibiscus syriacus]|uniref:Kinase superfamily protein n=1 Tax=Hibiscus syriacus TaxID=106335 RepID=A0A6A3AIP1_HIBSY|nr:Kinase superfamily protein [Hibiscus syriacus]